MVYYVIGLMSGSSLDGLDIAYTELEETRGAWGFKLVHTACIPYPEKWCASLVHAVHLNVDGFLKLHTAYGRYTGELVNDFIARHHLGHKVHFIASHGHTVFHEPANGATFQLGDGAAISAVTGLPVINDLRAADVALGGQGAPIVPIGDKLLFGNYDYLLNIGGIANLTITNNGQPVAYDICPANQVLNALAQREGMDMDTDGLLAAKGKLLPGVLDELNSAAYYKLPPPKSLSNEVAIDTAFPALLESGHSNHDRLHTMCTHIAQQIAVAVQLHPHAKETAVILVTGGGAFNKFLVACIEKELAPYKVAIVLPADEVIKYKEALVMALIGALRWREEANVLSSVTGAHRDSIGGALWIV